MSAFIDMTGQRIGRWTVIAPAMHRKWLCICDCGNKREVQGAALRRGATSSCGCWKAEKLTRHGHARKNGHRTPTYQCWYAMIQRTTNPNVKQFKDYGGRGIAVCDEWRDFANFLADMGERPEGMSLDRINNDGGYSKSNCRWASRKEQQLNQRRTRWLTIGGETKPLAVWARESGLYPCLVRNRIVNRGWSHKRAITTPITVT